ncbi:type VII secretion integral membrane protein EccD [Spongisporangium articulatum]|uniref:Type VII secretion integral membrane protein EccD n=1 Tax=Spongisporangium articulatum TaxID=3362603 RepID=A0ABW8AU00_9ACTN
MDSEIQGDLCRVTVVSPSARIDVALPENVPLIDVVPVLVRQAVEAPGASPETALPNTTWSLQRLGDTPLDVGLTPAELSLRDGEILYLRPREAELPELAFDDVADAIATAKAQHTRSWTGTDTRRAGLTAMVVTSGVTALVLALSGPPWLAVGGAAAGISAGLVLLATVLSRSFSDARAGAVAGFVAAGFAGLAGALLVRGDGPFDTTCVVAAAAALLLVATAGGVGTAAHLPAYVGVGTAALVTLAVAASSAVWELPTTGAAALAAALALALTQAAPALSLRLADLPLPTIPFTAEDVRADDSWVDGTDIVLRARLADQYVTALVGGTMLVTGASSILLARAQTGTAPWLLGVLALATALRARVLDGRWQRGFLLATAVLGGNALAVATAAGASPLRQVLVVLALLASAGAAVTAGLMLPGRTVSPVWRRLLDIVDGLAVTAVVPLTLSVMGVFGYVRGLAG